MVKDKHITEVLFRKEKGGSILAVFPYDIWCGSTGTCYAHIGQHSACIHEYAINDCKPATKVEYADLLKELNSLGYNLKVIKRRNYDKFLKAYYAAK